MSQPISVVPIKTGLEKDKEPFILENDAFPVLDDAYLYQGKIVKKQGNQHLGRLVQVDTDLALGDTGASPFTANIITTLPAAALGISPGSATIDIAAPVGPLAYTDDGEGVLTAPGPYVGTIDYVTGAISINHPAAAASAVTITFEYYTGRPVMGLSVKEKTTTNIEDLVAFDTVKANIWHKGTNKFEDISVDTAGAVVQWTGSDSQFFWVNNYYLDTSGNKLLWATNNKQYSVSGGGLDQDGISIYNGTGWEVQTPQLDAGGTRFLNGCRLLVSYKNRMLALNTLESSAVSGVVATRHSNRSRWSQNGVPYTDTIGGFQADSWYDVQVGKGGYIDAPTSEAIMSCGFYKDVLIVFFERSTWKLTYTGEAALPFIWNRTNTNDGCESTNSIINFDKGIMAVGDKAIIASDSYNVERIDDKIPLEVFKFHNQNDGPARVYGIRDFFFRFAYWTFPNLTGAGTYPNRILVFNYDDGSYSIFNDSYTCFGYYQASEDLTWEKATFSWESSSRRWNSSAFQSDYPAIVGGNQVGFVNILNTTTTQDISLYVTNITQAEECIVTAPVNNLVEGQYVYFSSVQGMTEINGITGKIVAVPGATTLTVDIDTSGFSAYTASGFLSVKSNIEIITKRYNPYFAGGSNTRLKYLDVFVNKTDSGEFTMELYIDSSRTAPIDTVIVSTAQDYGPDIPMEKMWQRVYLSGDGQFVQFKITMSEAQMKDVSNQQAEIVINALNIWLSQSGSLMSYT